MKNLTILYNIDILGFRKKKSSSRKLRRVGLEPAITKISRAELYIRVVIVSSLQAMPD